MLRELNRVIDYIEGHLCDDLTLESIAAYAGVADYHFRKIFYYVSGMTLSEYIRNRRLAQANAQLLEGVPVTDVSYRYGYDSMDGFTRAFKSWSGFLPSDVFKKGYCKSFPRLSFAVTVKGGVSVEFRIEKMPAFNLAGVSRRVPLRFEGVNQEIVKLAMSITQEQREAMHALRNIAPYEVVNASWDSDVDFLTEEGDLTHLIGVLTTEDDTGTLLEKVTVSANTWAVFPGEGPFPSALQQTMADIYAQWLPTSGYELVKEPSFSFTRMDKQRPDVVYYEVWVPVIKR